MKATHPRLLLPVFAILLAATHRASAQGSITPPSAPTVPIMKTLSQVEPRIPIPGGGAFTITSPGSYYLTGDITTSGPDTGITIGSSNVTLDLSGFTITADAANSGICISFSAQGSIDIRNGALRGGLTGISIGAGANARGIRIDSINVSNCSHFGIYTTAVIKGLTISNCMITSTGGYTGTMDNSAIYAFSGCVVENCTIDTVTGTSATRGFGLNLDTGAIARNNQILNCATGIRVGICQNNLTSSCTVPFGGIVDAGGNH
jgi:hypothetical protein